MLSLNDFPVIFENTLSNDALDEMDKFQLGVAYIVNNKNKLVGILIVGDIHRKLSLVQKTPYLFSLWMM